MKMTKKEKLEIFEDAFMDDTAGSWRTCNCGKDFYNSNGRWDWDEGRLEALEKDYKAIDLDYSVGTITFEGTEYCLDCDCWHKRALMIFGFVMSHNSAIVSLFRAVKKHKLAKAESIAVE
jgi:hypothetical protein